MKKIRNILLAVATSLCALTLMGCPTAVTTTVKYAIGDTGPGGGIVFMTWSEGYHGYEAAPTDQSAGYLWNSNITEFAGRASDGITPEALGDSHSYSTPNTDKIINNLPGESAAKIARNYTGGGKNDWDLPPLDALYAMYQFLRANGKGGFTDALYWSSSEYATNKAWAKAINFTAGGKTNIPRTTLCRVRAMRQF